MAGCCLRNDSGENNMPLNNRPAIQVIMVPAGAEYKAVKRSLKNIKKAPELVAIPAGPQAARRFIVSWAEQHSTKVSLLLIGLGGSLSANYGVGEGVLVKRVWNGFEENERTAVECDGRLTAQIAARIGVATGVGMSCDRIITTAKEKRELGDRYSADIVDMESFSLLQALPDCEVAILRVISDDCRHNLPNIADAIGPDGSLKPILLTIGFVSQPVAALRFIKSALKGLEALEALTLKIFRET